MPRRVWLLDASVYIFRAYFGMPDAMRGRDGQPIHAVHGFTRLLLQLLEGLAEGEHCAAAFDESLGSCFRNAIFPAYKQSRSLPDDELGWQLQACREVAERLGLPCHGGVRYEADDYLATLARVSRRDGHPVTVLTRDKDLGQLLALPADQWWDFPAGEPLDAAGFTGRFGVPPERFADYLALVGDPVDDIPGVPGVGPKTAAALVAAFADLTELGNNLPAVAELPIRGGAGVAARLAEYWPTVLLARRLTGLEERIPGIRRPRPWRIGRSRAEAAAAYLEDIGLPAAVVRRCRGLAASGRAA